MLKHVLTLLTGTGIAQAIPIAFMPILTRIYTPEEFGVLALYVAVSSSISVMATARYELAIMLPESDKDAASLAVLATMVSIIVSLISAWAIFVFNGEIASFLNNDEVGKWLYLVPISIFFSGLYQTLSYWSNRKRCYRRMAHARVLQGSSITGIQLLAGSIKLHGGLIFGQVVGLIVTVLGFLKWVWKIDYAAFKQTAFPDILRNAKRYKEFPLFSSVGAMMDSAAAQVPVMAISKFFNAYITGMFSLTFRALSIPVSLVSSALAQVLFQRLVTLSRENPAAIPRYLWNIFFMLLSAMLPFIACIWVFGEEIFALVFGSEWREAGKFAALLSIAVAVRFSVSPLSMVMMIEPNIRLGVAWQATYFFTIILVVITFSGLEIYNFIIVFVVHDVCLYMLYLGLIMVGAKRLQP